MIVSHGLRTVFVHVPKCAGTSVREALSRIHDDPTRFYGVRKIKGSWGLATKDVCHLTPRELCETAAWDTSDYLHLVVTRDPVSRWLSAYSEYQRHCWDCFRADGAVPPMAMLRQIVAWREAGDDRLSTDVRYVHMRPQSDFVTAARTALVPMEALGDPGLRIRNTTGSVVLSGPLPKTNDFVPHKMRFGGWKELQRMKTGDLREEARALILRAYPDDALLHARAREEHARRTAAEASAPTKK